MPEHTFNIAKDFSPHPGPRLKIQGPHSGETLRGRLAKLLRTKPGRLVIVLDGTSGYGSSFLDEAFGGLVRAEKFQPSQVLDRIKLVSTLDPTYVDEIIDSIRRAQPTDANAS